MFTGLVQAAGRVASLAEGRLAIQVEPYDEPWKIGESVAVNGACLTVVGYDGMLEFDLSQETLERTNLGDLRPGDLANIERALRIGDRLGGHFVLGHVDATGEVLRVGELFRFQVPDRFDGLLIDKGSIAIDGISLTIVRPEQGAFDVAVIPHTLEATNLGRRKPGDRVNVEFDMLAKHVAKMAVTGGGSAGPP